MTIWLHRISYHSEISYPLLEKGYLSVGFSDFSDQEFIDSICTEGTGWNTFEEKFEQEWGSKPRTRHNLWRFIRDMKKGNLVIVPSWGTFSVYEIVDDYAIIPSNCNENEFNDWNDNHITINSDGLFTRKIEDKEEIIDLGFLRKVKLIKKDIPRYEYADAALTSRMKIRQTNADISDLKESVEKAIQAFNESKPINLHSIILEKTKDIIIDNIRNELNPDKFEKLIQWYFQRIGASDVYIPTKNENDKEGDADVVAVFEPIKTIIYSQVKFHNNGDDTPSWAIEQIKSYKEHKEAMDDGYSKISWVVTSADSFTEEAYEYAKEAKVQLVDIKQLTQMLLDVGIVNLDKAI